jgi:FixJ family two-component response regulator
MSAEDSGTVFIVDDDKDVRDSLQELAGVGCRMRKKAAE